MIEDCYRTCILPAAVNLQTADGSPMSSTGKASLHLQIADFKISHTSVICGRLPEADFLFGIDLQKPYSLSYCWDSNRHLFIQREASILTYTINKEDLDNIALVQSMLKKFHLDIMVQCQSRSEATTYREDQVAYFISSQHT